MNFNNLDLNLLVVFDSVFDEGSITKASDKLNLSKIHAITKKIKINTILREISK